MTRSVWRSLVLAAVAALDSGGCRESTDPSVSPILSNVQVKYAGGSAEIFTSLRFSLSMAGSGPDTGATPRYAVFETTAIRDGDEGTVLVARPDNDPDFTHLAALLSDGIDEQVTTGTGVGSSAPRESLFFAGKSVTGPDFAGYIVDSIEFRIDSVSITTPGSNPNGNGFWTDYDLVGRLVLLGHHN